MSKKKSRVIGKGKVRAESKKCTYIGELDKKTGIADDLWYMVCNDLLYHANDETKRLEIHYEIIAK